MLTLAFIFLVITVVAGFCSYKYREKNNTKRYVSELLAYFCFVVFVTLLITYLAQTSPPIPHEPMPA